MNILIVGGTRFQGRYLVKELLDGGHTVTVFHRGGHAIEPQSGLTDLIGERSNSADLARLAGQTFDACIDTCAYFPAQIDLLADVLKTRHYTLISSVYVYVDQDALLDEGAPLDSSPVAQGKALTPKNYGALKAQCEESAKRHFGKSCLIIRPSIIIGPGDHTERLAFWIRMVAKHRKRIDIAVAAPVLQLLDVRDLARFTVQCVTAGRSGPVNVCGQEIGFAGLLDAIAEISGTDCDRRMLRPDNINRSELATLPYLDGERRARYANRLAAHWGFAGRMLQASLADILVHARQDNFAIRAFHSEEAAVLRLFS